jgi:flagellar basal-body rod protein FlgC
MTSWRQLMIGAISSALSGLIAFSTQINVTAHNIANVNTDWFKKSHYGPTQMELSNVDLAEEAVNRIAAQREFEANLQAIKTADDMLGSLLDFKK